MFYRIEDIPTPECMQRCVEQLAMLVPVRRREQAFCYKHLHGQYCCLRTWQMLHELLIEHAFLPASFPLSDLTFTVDDYGKPSLSFEQRGPQRACSHGVPCSGLCPLSAAVCFSISHTKNALAVAVSEHEVGIDIEMLVSPQRLCDKAFLDYTLSPQEQAQLRAADTIEAQRIFTRLWTRKEALFKALGTGINVRELPFVLEKPHPYTIRSYDGDAYVCSLAYCD